MSLDADKRKNGTRGLFLNGLYKEIAREQLNVTATNGGEAYDSFDETMMTVWMKILTDDLSDGFWLLFQEWYSGSFPSRLKINKSPAGVRSIIFEAGGTNCTDAGHCEISSVFFPLNKWVQLKVYYRHSQGSDGRIVFKFREDGGAVVDVFDYTGRTRFGGQVEGWNVIKRYMGSVGDNIGVAWDDLVIYDPAVFNGDNLPPWD